jgi:two-component sensor histidine kinase
MHLIVGVLMIQARGEADPEILALLRRAGSRSQLISQIHRDFSGEPVSTLEFCEFSRSLARIVCAEAKAPEDRIEVLGDAVRLPVEVATSLGVALVECLTWIAARHPSSRLRIRLRREDERVMVMVSQFGDPGPDIVAMTQGAFMFRAMVEQAGAEVIFAANSLDGPAIEIALPVPAPTVALADAGMTLH